MDYRYGTFLREQKTRFLCDVLIEDQEEECYIPASCKLSKFVDLTGKQVVLQAVDNPRARTRYSVYAAKLGRRYVLLNLAEANRVVERQLQRRLFAYLGKRKQVRREVTINDYKADLFIEDTQTLVEVKTLLAFEKEGCFPSMDSKRAVEQLRKISKLLETGYRVNYMIVSLNPTVERIKLNEELAEYCNLFQECVDKGMGAQAFSVRLSNMVPEIISGPEFIIKY